MGIANELGLVQREVLQEERGQVSIFSKVQQVLHVPVALLFLNIRCTNTVLERVERRLR